jgi:hypothetical protein
MFPTSAKSPSGVVSKGCYYILERTESGRRIFTNARLQHELARKMRESARIGPSGAPSAPQVSNLPEELKVDECNEKCHFQPWPSAKFAPRSKRYMMYKGGSSTFIKLMKMIGRPILDV